MNAKPVFSKPGASTWQEDRPDIDAHSSTQFVYNAHHSLALDMQRKRLPIFRNRDHIIYLLEKYQTLVLVGETGCGKSTQLPQYLLEAGWCEDGKIIGITEPRRVAATSLASRVADERNCIFGTEVGYCIRFDDCTNESTKIKYMTEGILLRELMSDPLLTTYAIIVLDEVHERTLMTDIIMGLLKKIIRKRKSLKIVVSSATVDAEQLRDFFNMNTTKDSSKDTAVIMSVEGRLYPVDIFYVREPVPNYVTSVVDTALKIHEVEEPGDILAFLTGLDEVDQAVSLLSEHAKLIKDGKLKLQPLAMYGSLPNNEQLKVFWRAAKDTRKVIVATNIAETSITIPNVVYVIDCGFVKMPWFEPETQTNSLTIVPVSKASADQRAGRAGRVQSGKTFRLYTEEAYKELPEATPPEMQRSDLAPAVLQLKALGIDNVLRFNFPSAPPSKNLIAGMELLYALGAIDNDGQLTTPLGMTMAEMPLEPTFGKCLIVSGQMGCSEAFKYNNNKFLIMDTPVLTKQQQRQSLSGKRTSIKLRNVLAQPHDNYWPVVKQEDKVKLNSILKELLPVLRRPPGKKRRHKENEPKGELEVSEEPFPKRDMLNSVVLGVNTVTRSLEKDEVCCVLLDANVEPPLLIKHIVMMAQRKEIPFLLVSSLKDLTFETIGFSSTTLGLKKIVLSLDHHFHKLYNSVLDISKNYPAPIRSLQTLSTDMDTETTLDCTIIKSDKVNDSVSKKESTFGVNEEFISMENIYKFRSSCKERVFIPPNVICDNTKNIDDKTPEFIPFNDVNLNDTDIPSLQNTRYFNPPSEKDKSNNGNTTYLPLKVLQLRGNSNRTKATKAPKKKKPKINKTN